MNYAEAVNACLSGQKLTRDCWKADGGYIAFLTGLKCFLRVKTAPEKMDVGPWLAAIEDSLAEDWSEWQVEVSEDTSLVAPKADSEVVVENQG